ncbi:MAG: hypothetical protein P8166_12455 [Candidatus Thiodiazotropha sp.]
MNGDRVDIGYPLSPELALSARVEQMSTSNYRNGINAGLTATQAGIAVSDDTPRGVSMVVEWNPCRSTRLLGERHHDDSGSSSENIVLLRLQKRFEYTHSFTQ